MLFIKEMILSISIINLIDIDLFGAPVLIRCVGFKGTRSFQILVTLIGTGVF